VIHFGAPAMRRRTIDVRFFAPWSAAAPACPASCAWAWNLH